MDARAERFRQVWSWVAAVFVVVVFWTQFTPSHRVMPALLATRIFAVLGPAAVLISIRRGARRGLPLLAFLTLWVLGSLLLPGHAPWTTVILGPLLVMTFWVLGRHGWLPALPWLLLAAAAGPILVSWPHPAPGLLAAALPFAGLEAWTRKGSRAVLAGLVFGLGLVAAYVSRNPAALLGAAAVLALLSATGRAKHRPAVSGGVWVLVFAAAAAAVVMVLQSPSPGITVLAFPDGTRELASGLQTAPLGILGILLPPFMWLGLFVSPVPPQTQATPDARTIRIAAAVSLAGSLCAGLTGPRVPLGAPILWLVYGVVMAGVSAQEESALHPKTLK